MRKEKQRYGLRKLSVGVVSCFLGSAIYLGANMNVQAEEVDPSQPIESETNADSLAAIETDGSITEIEESVEDKEGQVLQTQASYYSTPDPADKKFEDTSWIWAQGHYRQSIFGFDLFNVDIDADKESSVYILGDIVIRQHSDDLTVNNNYQDTNSDAFLVNVGDYYDINTTLDTRQIKAEIASMKGTNHSFETFSVSDATTVWNVSSKFYVRIVFPDSVSLKEVNVDDIDLRYFLNGDYRNVYEDTSSLPANQVYAITDTYAELDKYGKFNLDRNSIVIDQENNTIYLEMPFDTSKFDQGDWPDWGGDGSARYNHYLMLNTAVQATPDYLTLNIPNIKIVKSTEGLQQIQGEVCGTYSSYVGMPDAPEKSMSLSYYFASSQDTSVDGRDGSDAYSNGDGILLSIQSTDRSYKVEYYYQEDGQYPSVPNETVIRDGQLGQDVEVTSLDKTPNRAKYVLDENNENNIFKVLIQDGQEAVLRLYFKQQYTVTYVDGVDDQVIFEDQVYSSIDYGKPTPSFEGSLVREGYQFNGWLPEYQDTVTMDMVYVAQWVKLPDDPQEPQEPKPNPQPQPSIDPTPEPEPEPTPNKEEKPEEKKKEEVRPKEITEQKTETVQTGTESSMALALTSVMTSIVAMGLTKKRKD